MLAKTSPGCEVKISGTALASLFKPGGNSRRFAICGLSAIALHLAVTLLHLNFETLENSIEQVASAAELEVALDVEVPQPLSGPAPGGGSENLEPDAPKETTLEQPIKFPKAEKRVVLAKTENDLPQLSEQLAEEPTLDDAATEAPDVLTQASNHKNAITTARVEDRPKQRVTATATRVAVQASALGAAPGSGPGSGSGPGGRAAGFGNGNGVVQRSFQFGGPRGAFRADVCFIPEGTKSIKEIHSCRRVATFYTDALDVSPRSFNEGFPGVSERTEWFSIEYTGKFRVQAGDYYTFRLLSDDGALLYIDGYLIVDNDGQHPPASKTGTVPLAAGYHEFRVRYYQGPADRLALQLFVTGADGKRRLLGPVI
jgi:hypothetical protein